VDEKILLMKLKVFHSILGGSIHGSVTLIELLTASVSKNCSEGNSVYLKV
jgi:hypothetical protein